MYSVFMVKKAADNSFGTRLHRVRSERGMTLQQVADALNIGLRAYQNYESGHRSPSLDGLRALSKTLNVSIDYLLGLTDEDPSD